jgi:hypothetical protein
MEQRKIWMRYLIIGINLVFIYRTTSCTKETEQIKTINYIYRNQTNVDLIMEIYNSNKELFKSFKILKNKEVETNTTKQEGGPALFYFDSFDSKIGDSIAIKFQDNKCLYYSRNIPDKIFKIEKYDNYTTDLNNQNSYTLFFSFTNEDYLQAKDCN